MLQLQGAQCEPSQYRYLQCAAEKHHLQLQAALTPAYKELLAERSLQSGQTTPRGSAHDADPRGVLASAAVFSARPPQARKICTATQRMLQNDVLENRIFKPRPKLAESSSKHARLAPSQLEGDGGAVDGWRSGRLQLRYDHSERSEPEGVVPPSR